MGTLGTTGLATARLSEEDVALDKHDNRDAIKPDGAPYHKYIQKFCRILNNKDKRCSSDVLKIYLQVCPNLGEGPLHPQVDGWC